MADGLLLVGHRRKCGGDTVGFAFEEALLYEGGPFIDVLEQDPATLFFTFWELFFIVSALAVAPVAALLGVPEAFGARPSYLLWMLAGGGAALIGLVILGGIHLNPTALLGTFLPSVLIPAGLVGGLALAYLRRGPLQARRRAGARKRMLAKPRATTLRLSRRLWICESERCSLRTRRSRRPCSAYG